MQGIKEIEGVLEIAFAPLAGVEQQQEHGAVAIETDLGIRKAGGQQRECQQENPQQMVPLFQLLSPARICQRSEYRHHHPPEAVIQLHLAVQHIRCADGHRNYRQQPMVFSALPLLQQINDGNGAGEGKQNIQIGIAGNEEIHQLTPCAQQEDAQKIPQAVFGVKAAFGDHEGKNRKGQSTDHTENGGLGKENNAHVVNEHGNGGDQLQHIAGDAPLGGYRDGSGHRRSSLSLIFYIIKKVANIVKHPPRKCPAAMR